MSQEPRAAQAGDHRPTSVREKQEFSSGGRSWMLLLRGRWGLKVDKAILRLTGYSLITAQYAWARGEKYVPTLVLTTIGAKTRKLRTACLPWFRVGDDLVVRGSHGGGPTDPGWVHNVRAHPHAWIRMGRERRAVHAHVAAGDERQRLYAALCEMSSSTARYAEMCNPRELPLVVLRDWDRAGV
jgi:deazaflavin-dependent oxidoreductase (nitroreductase family)